MVVGFSAREGAVLHAVSLQGRPVAWRLSFAEMVVPYADTQHPHYLKARARVRVRVRVSVSVRVRVRVRVVGLGLP